MKSSMMPYRGIKRDIRDVKRTIRNLKLDRNSCANANDRRNEIRYQQRLLVRLESAVKGGAEDES